MKTVLAILLTTVGIALADTPWKPCDGVSGSITVTNVSLPGCNAAPCVLKKGTNASVGISYTLTADMAAVYNQVYGIIGGVPVKFPGYPASQKNACSLGMKCPAKKGDVNTETVQLPVSSLDPSIKLIAEWKLSDDADGNSIQGCFEVPLQITS